MMKIEDILEAMRKLGELEAKVDTLYGFLENEAIITDEDVCLIMGFDDLYKKLKKAKEDRLKGCVASV